MSKQNTIFKIFEKIWYFIAKNDNKERYKENLPVIKKEVNGSASKNQEVIFKSSQINKDYDKKFFFKSFEIPGI